MVFATSMIVSTSVSYHSRTVPVKRGPAASAEESSTSEPVSLLTNLPGARDQKRFAPRASVRRSLRISRSISRATCSERICVSSTSASSEWYALRSCASSGDQRARSLRVAAVTAMDSTLMSISGMTGEGVAPKSDSKEGMVRVEPTPSSTFRESAIAKDAVRFVEPPVWTPTCVPETTARRTKLAVSHVTKELAIKAPPINIPN